MQQLELPFDPAPSVPRQPKPRRAPSARRPEALVRLGGLVQRHLGRRRPLPFAVRFNPRLRSTLGRADFTHATVELNPRLLDRHPDELVPTLLHELCHLLAGPRAGHGPRWRELMTRLGLPARACHDLDTSAVRSRRRAWAWRCARCGSIYVRRHRGARRFRCGDCGGRLRVERELASAGANE